MPRAFLLAGAGLLATPAHAQTAFQLTLTNTGAASWDQGVLAVLPGGVSPDSLLPIGQTPNIGDPYDTYTYAHQACDQGVEDDGDAALLISRWPSLTEGVNAFRVGPLGPGANQVVNFTAWPGDVVSFVARITGSADDVAMMHPTGDMTDPTVDLFDPSNNPLPTVDFQIGGFDVNEAGPNGGLGSCATTCPPPVPCYIAPGGGAGGGGAQPAPGGCSAVAWFTDADGDGMGAGNAPAGVSCTPPAASAPVGGDCDDTDPAVTGPVAWYQDVDGDGVGGNNAVIACGPPGGYTGSTGDCSDADPDNWASCASCVDSDGDGSFVGCDAYTTRPGPDCDDTNPALSGSTTWYDDADGDGFGDPLSGVVQCAQPPGAVLIGGDCNDGDFGVNPAAVEVCGGGDEDCDGLVDDADGSLDPGSTPTWYGDADGDGFGDPAAPVTACIQPGASSADGTDCSDADPDNWASCASCVDSDGDGSFAGCDAYTTRPGPDCDDTNPALSGSTIWYDDADGDGFGDPLSGVVQCAQPPGAVLLGGDCDDGDFGVNPAAIEVCGGGDEDCDGLVDDADGSLDPGSTPTWYGDADGDGFGDPAAPVTACIQPGASSADGTDCSDADPDNWASCASCVDSDGDGSFAGCDAYTTRVGPDCDDTDPALNAGTVWYVDADGDGAGDPASATVQCSPPGSGVLAGGDCDDADAAVFPGALEVCSGIDEDCDGLIDDADPDLDPLSTPVWFFDADGDGFGDGGDASSACTQPANTEPVAGDCDDAAADVYPGGTETCDGRDEDCNGQPDNNAIDAGVWYIDSDQDGHGDPASGTASCVAPPGQVLLGDDCDDLDDTVNPGALEFCDGKDNDCNGLVDDGAFDAAVWYADADADGYGDPTLTTLACTAPAGFSPAGGDCDDGSAATYPGAPEQCDGLDNDCDTQIDNDVVFSTWYADGDGDGWGTDATTLYDCAQPADTADRPGDCDDTNPDVHPDAVEVPDNGVDEDCDGSDATTEDTGVPEVPDTPRDWQPDTGSKPVSAPLAAGCDCSTAPSAPSGAWLALGLLLWRRRRA